MPNLRVVKNFVQDEDAVVNMDNMLMIERYDELSMLIIFPDNVTLRVTEESVADLFVRAAD